MYIPSLDALQLTSWIVASTIICVLALAPTSWLSAMLDFIKVAVSAFLRRK